MADLDAIGEETLLGLVEQGMTLRSMFAMFDIGRRAYYKWVDSVEGRYESFRQAREAYAESLDEESIRIADSVELDKDAIAKAKLRIDARRHRAQFSDPSRREKGQAASTVVNIGTLHLAALKENMAGELPPGDDDHDEEDVVDAEWEMEEQDD